MSLVFELTRPLAEWRPALFGLILILLIGLTFVDVIGRYVFGAPILGAKDILEMGMVCVISLAFPFTWRMGGHIVVDLIPDYPVLGLTIARDVIVRLLALAIFALLAWQAWLRAEDAALFNEATNMISLPFRPFFFCLAGASLIQSAVLAVETIFLVAGRPIDLAVGWARAIW